MNHRRTVIFAFTMALALSTTVDEIIAAPLPKDPVPTTPFVQWTNTKDFVSNDPHDPIVVKDMVIVGTDRGELRAYRCKNGELLWNSQHGSRIYHRPCSDGERIYFTSAKGLVAVAIADGSSAWGLDSESCNGPTLVLEKKGLVYVGRDDGILSAHDSKAGKEQWKSDFIADAPKDPPGFSGEQARFANKKARPSNLSSDGETLFLSVFDQCRIVAIDATSGKRLWSFQSGGWVHGAAVATEKHVFFGSQDQFFYCLDKKTGKQVWKFETNRRIESGGAVDEKFVYFGSCNGNVYCLNQISGEKQWEFATDVDANGRMSSIYSDPIFRNNGVCFTATEGQTYLINRETGKLTWKLRPSDGSELVCSPATDGKLIFVTSRARDKGIGAPSLMAIGLK